MTAPPITLFTTTRPFEGVHAAHQRNALGAWRRLTPTPQVLIVGDDHGASDAARDLELEFEPEVRRSPSGLPYLSDVFARAQARASAPLSGYANADIVFPPDLQSGVDHVARRFPSFLMIGQRWDVVQDQEVDLSDLREWVALRDRALQRGVLRGPYWVDYFIFRTGEFLHLPDLILGRPGWDNWLVWHARDSGLPVVDATDYLTVLHHDHSRTHGPRSTKVAPGSDADWNRRIIGTERHMYTVGHATHRLTRGGSIVPARGSKYAAARFLNHVHPLLRATRTVRHQLGIEADTVQRLAARMRR